MCVCVNYNYVFYIPEHLYTYILYTVLLTEAGHFTNLAHWILVLKLGSAIFYGVSQLKMVTGLRTKGAIWLYLCMHKECSFPVMTIFCH